jgi:hypothetical protein
VPPSLHMDVDLTTKKTPAAATARAEAIRLNVQQAGVLYTKALELDDWKTLKYTSLRAWAQGEFGPDRFSAERRKEIVAMLSKAGLTVRAIAAATGTHHRTVERDQEEARGANAPRDSPAPEQTPRQTAAKTREATKREAIKVQATKPRVSRGPTAKSGTRVSQDELNELALRALKSRKSQSEFARGLGIGDNSMMLAKAWTRAEMLVHGEVKPNGKPKNWNGKSPAGRLRELGGSKRLNYLDVSRFQWEIAKATEVLTSFKLADYVGDGSEPEIDVLTRLQDDLISLSTWLDAQLMGVQGYLSTYATREKIAKLRDTTGRTAEEIEAYTKAADRLERQLNKSLEA